MPEAYQPTDEEKKLLANFTLSGTVHEWDTANKIKFIAFINKRAGLPFGTIGLLRTEHEDWKTKAKIIKEIPYATRQTTVELGRLHRISVTTTDRQILPDMAIYTARAEDLDTGREVDATGACALVKKDGTALVAEQRANKIMHADTKSKRRATLEICGLAFLDDSEVQDMEGAKEVALKAPDATPDATPEGATTESPKAPQSKGNGKASTSPATTTVTTPASAPQSPAPTAAESSKGSVGSPAVEAPKQAAAESVESSPATDVAIAELLPVPSRYADNDLFVGPDDEIVGKDSKFILFIVDQCKTQCGWDGQTMSKWLFETFGITNKNAATELTRAAFKRIMTGVDEALTAAGR